MNSHVRPTFWRAYARLSESNRQAARRAYALFAENPDHPSLRFKKLAGCENVWSVRINEQYRAVGERHGDTISWRGSAPTMNSTASLAKARHPETQRHVSILPCTVPQSFLFGVQASASRICGFTRLYAPAP